MVDRKKDMVISGGQNIYPSEIEQVIAALPDVSEVAVVGVPDEVWGEHVAAVVVRRPGSMLTESDVTTVCRQRLAGYKSPKEVLFWDTLPKNVLNKILKREIRSNLRARAREAETSTGGEMT